uniref:Alpha-macroglobulin receptor-binding domain-containing protein n=1 Tax=Anopheles culicifacies TaxID=139723 RepID=A0A182LRP3_9DIPT
MSYTKSIAVPLNVGVPFSFVIKARPLGEMTIRVSASIKAVQETYGLEKVIRVMPESLVQRKSQIRLFCFDTFSNKSLTMKLDVDSMADTGSTRIEFRLTPNLLTTVINNLDNLLTVPSASGQHNMLEFVPNIVVLVYLQAIGSNDRQLIDDATNLVRQGYHRQMRYRRADGSYTLWENVNGGVFLTAFVAKSMQTASKYISVDMAKVEKAYDWLASKQHSSGRFEEVGSVFYKDMQGCLRNGSSLTSYVLTALLENENAKLKHAAVIQKAMSYLTSQLESINNPYELSIATYALMLQGHNMKKKSLKKLIEMSTFTKNIEERYWNVPKSIGTTALNLVNFKSQFTLDLKKQNTTSDYELRLRVCASFIPYQVERRSNMALIEVNLPSGFVADRNPISAQSTLYPIQNIEIRYGGTSVLVYYDHMDENQTCFTVTAFQRRKVVLKRPAYVVVYDTINSNWNAIQMYEMDDQDVCESCDAAD